MHTVTHCGYEDGGGEGVGRERLTDSSKRSCFLKLGIFEKQLPSPFKSILGGLEA